MQTVPAQPLASFLEGPAHPREAGARNKPGASTGNVINWEEKGILFGLFMIFFFHQLPIKQMPCR